MIMELERLRSLRNEAYNKAIEWKMNSSHSSDDPLYKKVNVLLRQFNYGIEPKNELLETMVELGVMKYE